MPIISRFPGIIVTMNYRDHDPPHRRVDRHRHKVFRWRGGGGGRRGRDDAGCGNRGGEQGEDDSDTHGRSLARHKALSYTVIACEDRFDARLARAVEMVALPATFANLGP